MHKVFPSATNIALLVNPATPLADQISQKISAAAATLGLKLQVLRVSSEQDLVAVFDSMTELKAEALVIGSDALFTNHAEQLDGSRRDQTSGRAVRHSARAPEPDRRDEARQGREMKPQTKE